MGLFVDECAASTNALGSAVAQSYLCTQWGCIPGSAPIQMHLYDLHISVETRLKVGVSPAVLCRP